MASATKKGSSTAKGKRKPAAAKARPAKSAGKAAGKPAGKPQRADKRRAAPEPEPTTPSIGEPERSAPPLAEIDAEALEFIEAIDRFKKQHGRPFPSWSEVLMVVRQLGYRRG